MKRKSKSGCWIEMAYLGGDGEESLDMVMFVLELRIEPEMRNALLMVYLIPHQRMSTYKGHNDSR